MSRIGKNPVSIPEGVTVDIAEDNVVSVKGPKGELSQALHKDMIIRREDNAVVVACPEGGSQNYAALWGLTRSLINNMVVGVTEGYKKVLTLKGVGYRALVDNNKLTLNVGYSHPVVMVPPEGVTVEAPEATKIIVSGCNKELVGGMAANIRKVRPVEPYKGKGIRYEGEQVKLKAGKTGK